MADEGHALGARRKIFSPEEAACLLLYAQEREEVFRRAPALYALGFVQPRERVRRVAKCRQVLEEGLLLAPVGEVRVREVACSHSLFGIAGPDGKQSVGLVEIERAQHERVYDAEYSRVCAYAERQRQHPDQSKSGILKQHPHAESYIVQQTFHLYSSNTENSNRAL